MLFGALHGCKPIYFVQIDSPKPTTFTHAQTVTMTASGIAGEDYVIEEMRFYHDGVLAGVDRDGPPYTYDWVIGPEDGGEHAWHAEALYRVRGVATEVLRSDYVVYLVSMSGVRALPPADGRGPETRCEELGESCLCSETLNVGAYASYACDRRPCANPEGSHSKQCSGEFGAGYAWYGEDALEVVETPGTGEALQSGNLVDYVWRSHSTAGVHHLTHHGGVTADTRRVCTRHYFRTSPDYNDGTLECSNRKHTDFLIGGGARVFFVRDQGPSYRLEMPGYSESEVRRTRGEPSNTWGVGDLDQEDCTHGWCRVELCVEGDILDLRGLSVEGYVQQVGTAKRVDFPKKLIGDAPRSGGLWGSWLLNMYREGESCTGWREFSHVMFAGWDTASGQTIGPAYEFEL